MGLGTRKTEGSAILDMRAVANVGADSQRALECEAGDPDGRRCIQES